MEPDIFPASLPGAFFLLGSYYFTSSSAGITNILIFSGCRTATWIPQSTWTALASVLYPPRISPSFLSLVCSRIWKDPSGRRTVVVTFPVMSTNWPLWVLIFTVLFPPFWQYPGCIYKIICVFLICLFSLNSQKYLIEFLHLCFWNFKGKIKVVWISLWLIACYSALQ